MLNNIAQESSSPWLLNGVCEYAQMKSIFCFLHPKYNTTRPSSAPDFFRYSISFRKPLDGAKSVLGPIINMGILWSTRSLKFEVLTKIGAQLQSLLSFNKAHGQEKEGYSFLLQLLLIYVCVLDSCREFFACSSYRITGRWLMLATISWMFPACISLFVSPLCTIIDGS